MVPEPPPLAPCADHARIRPDVKDVEPRGDCGAERVGVMEIDRVVARQAIKVAEIIATAAYSQGIEPPPRSMAPAFANRPPVPPMSTPTRLP